MQKRSIFYYRSFKFATRFYRSKNGVCDLIQKRSENCYCYKREVNLGATENNINKRSERDMNPQPTDLKSGVL